MQAGVARHLYVHVPFCVSKCPYCAFYSSAGPRELIHRYVEALSRELEWVSPQPAPETLFFGGGTPSVLTEEDFERLFAALERTGWGGAKEWTIEANPATVSFEKARLLREHGVNRVSLGVQSLDDELLRRLGRAHTRADAFRSFDILRKAGFENLNVDLMFGIPNQTLAGWRKGLVEALALGSEHLSAYELTYEEDTAFFDQMRTGAFKPDEDLTSGMFDILLDEAQAHGYVQFEVSIYASQPKAGSSNMPGFACRHNINYWRGGAFQGLGPSATSYVGGVRSKNLAHTASYCDMIERGLRPVETAERLTPLGRAGETAAFGLRMNIGWRFSEFEKVTGFNLRKEWTEDMAILARDGLGQIDAAGFRLTARGLRFADLAAERFLRP